MRGLVAAFLLSLSLMLTPATSYADDGTEEVAEVVENDDSEVKQESDADVPKGPTADFGTDGTIEDMAEDLHELVYIMRPVPRAYDAIEEFLHSDSGEFVGELVKPAALGVCAGFVGYLIGLAWRSIQGVMGLV